MSNVRITTAINAAIVDGFGGTKFTEPHLQIIDLMTGDALLVAAPKEWMRKFAQVLALAADGKPDSREVDSGGSLNHGGAANG